MSQEIIPPSFHKLDNQPDDVSATKNRWFKKLLWRTIATVIWVYIIVKLFIFDLDVYLAANYLPVLQVILDYKVFIFIGVSAAAVMLFDKWKALGFLAYLIFFPLIVTLFIFPSTIVK